MTKMYMVSLLSILPFTAPACGSAQGGGEAPEAPKVYFVRDITPENMVRLYEALERPPPTTASRPSPRWTSWMPKAR